MKHPYEMPSERPEVGSIDRPLWMRDAACIGSEELFFSPEGERGDSREARDAKARKICQGCPVLRECLDAFMDEPYGFFGGISERERHVLNARKNKYRRRNM